MVDLWYWIHGKINIGILALGLSMTLTPFLFYLSTEIKNETWAVRAFMAAVLTIPVILWLGIGGSYIMTR